MNDSLIIQVFASHLSSEAEAVLSAAERREAAAIEDSARRDRHVRTRSFVRRTLAACLECDPLCIEFQRTSLGKPFMANKPGCEFSLSHSKEWVAMAVASFEVGVDIEARSPNADPRALAARFFSAEDSSRIEHAGADASREFLTQWVAKEAALKAAGTGIAGHLEKLRCEFANGVPSAITGPAGAFAIRLFHLSDGSPGAVAWSATTCAPRICWNGPVMAAPES